MDQTHRKVMSTRTSTCTAASLLQLGGNFSVLPLELAFDILDELFLGMGHTGLCALRNLSLASYSSFQTVSAYLQHKVPSQHFDNVQWVSFPEGDADIDAADLGMEILPIDGFAETGPDIITSTILNDCPQCFDWLCGIFPGLDCESCNQHGWSFAAIAAYAGSAQILNHFLAKTNGARGSFFPLLGCEANPFDAIPETPFQILVYQRDLGKFERCLDVLEPTLFEANALYRRFDGVVGRAMFGPEDLLTICTFSTPSLAQRLDALGAPLYNILRGTGTSWHAAVQNGPELLSYINEHTAEKPTSRDFEGDTPLHVAIRLDRVDSVFWFSKYTDTQNFRWDTSYPESLEIACQLTSLQSLKCLDILLPQYPGWKMDSSTTSILLRTTARVTREAALTLAVQNHIDQAAYQQIRDELEDRAIGKTELILQNSKMDLFLEGRLDKSQRRTLRGTRDYRIYRQARLHAWLGGFGQLARAMQKIC